MTARTSEQLLADLVAFDTTSRNSNLALIDFIDDYLLGFGIESRRIFDETGTKANLWATIGPADQPGIVLSGHTDVVPVDGQPWTSDPFSLSEREGRLYGRGACDMKGFIACVLAAVPDMVRADLARPFHLAFSYDEEVGCIGARRMVETLAGEGVRPAYCIVGEPTLMEVVTAHKAKRSLRITVRGRACHSSLAPLGVNAVDYAAKLITYIRDVADDLTANGRRDEAFDIAHTTAHTGLVTGGTALNIVPDECVFLSEFRVLPGDDPDVFVNDLRAHAAELERDMRKVAPEASITVELMAQFPGLDTAPDAEITALAKRFAGTNGHAKVAYGTEAGLFAQYLGTETIICGPGAIAVAHRPDEYVERAQLQRCDEFLGRLIEWNR
ncbi:acetylornithine deacetylase [Aliihoeflea sp. PC F10.4]